MKSSKLILHPTNLEEENTHCIGRVYKLQNYNTTAVNSSSISNSAKEKKKKKKTKRPLWVLALNGNFKPQTLPSTEGEWDYFFSNYNLQRLVWIPSHFFHFCRHIHRPFNQSSYSSFLFFISIQFSKLCLNVCVNLIALMFL